MTYQIKLQQFEGPLDLLLHLIEKAQVDIRDIFISEVTEQYLVYLHHMKTMDMEIASEFLVIASTLIEIKSRYLLPKIKKNAESIEEEDPEQELIRKLLEYKMFKDVCSELREREKSFARIYYKLPEEYQVSEKKVQLVGLNLNDLYSAFEQVLKRRRTITPRVDIRQISRDQFTVREKIIEIQSLLAENSFILFRDLFSYQASRIEIVVSFMALLELLKLNQICIEQKFHFGDIFITSLNNGNAANV